jgi:hypothetical protein
LRLFRKFGFKVCLLTVAKAAELPRAFVEDGHEIVSKAIGGWITR